MRYWQKTNCLSTEDQLQRVVPQGCDDENPYFIIVITDSGGQLVLVC